MTDTSKPVTEAELGDMEVDAKTSGRLGKKAALRLIADLRRAREEIDRMEPVCRSAMRWHWLLHTHDVNERPACLHCDALNYACHVAAGSLAERVRAWVSSALPSPPGQGGK